MYDAQASQEQRIRVSAYHRWEDAGRPDGQEKGHWEYAEKLCEGGEVGFIQDTELSSDTKSNVSRVFKNTTGEPDAPRYLKYSGASQTG